MNGDDFRMKTAVQAAGARCSIRIILYRIENAILYSHLNYIYRDDDMTCTRDEFESTIQAFSMHVVESSMTAVV